MYSWSKTLLILMLALSIVVSPAYAAALSLDDAKAQGLVGETPTGYLGIVSGKSSPEATALMDSINAQRKDAYAKIAKKNGTPLQVVEQLAGKKAIDNTKPGQYVQNSNGSWTRK